MAASRRLDAPDGRRRPRGTTSTTSVAPPASHAQPLSRLLTNFRLATAIQDLRAGMEQDPDADPVGDAVGHRHHDDRREVASAEVLSQRRSRTSENIITPTITSAAAVASVGITPAIGEMNMHRSRSAPVTTDASPGPSARGHACVALDKRRVRRGRHEAAKRRREPVDPSAVLIRGSRPRGRACRRSVQR